MRESQIGAKHQARRPQTFAPQRDISGPSLLDSDFPGGFLSAMQLALDAVQPDEITG